MAYIQEASSWRVRRRRRQWITLVVVLAMLVAAGVVAYGFYSGAIGGPAKVDVASLPPCPTSSPTAPPLTPEKVTVNVYNATTRNGLAARVATALDLRTFRVGKIANDPRHAKVTGTAEVRYGAKGAAAARLVAAQVSNAKLVKDKRGSAVVDLVLGAKYAGLRPIAATSPTSTASPTCRPLSPTSAPTSTASPSGTATQSARPSATS